MRTPLIVAAAALLLPACETNNTYVLSGEGGSGGGAPITVGQGGQPGGDDDGDSSSSGDGGATSGGGETSGGGDSAVGGGGAGGTEPFLEGAPTPSVTPEEMDAELDMFGTDGHAWWFAVDPAVVERMNARDDGGGPFGDIYTPGEGSESGATYANHTFVTTPGEDPQTADYGKVEVRLIGESSWRPWAEDSIPNLRVDTDEFQDELEIAGYENFRFNNGQVGSIYREEIALEV